jgi:SAM-dependent methyltransferase
VPCKVRWLRFPWFSERHRVKNKLGVRRTAICDGCRGEIGVRMAGKFHSSEQAVRWLLRQPDRKDLVEALYLDPPLVGAAERFRESEEWQAVRALLPKKLGRALDVGAGNGIASYALARDGWRTTALEPDASELVGATAIGKLAAETELPINIVAGFAEKLPFPDDCFDLVYGRQVLHHAQQLEKLCSELIRVLKPGAMLIASREHVVSNGAQLKRFLREHPLHERYGGENAFRLSQYKRALRRAGAERIKVVRPLDSVINYAPQTRRTLQAELRERIERLGGKLAAWPFSWESVFDMALRVLAIVDRRPGRPFSFIARKPLRMSA